MQNKLIQWAVPVLLLILVLLSGCTSDRSTTGNNYLLRIDKDTINRADYEEALEIAKTAYPYEALQDEDTLRGIKNRLLKQLTEELILSKRARELGLRVTESELQDTIAAIKADYPEGAFEEVLFENAVSFTAWKKRLKMRLLMEKVIRRELMENVTVTPEEVKAYYERQYQEIEGKMPMDHRNNIMIVKRLRREKARRQYPDWIDRLQQNYPVELNANMWERILQLP